MEADPPAPLPQGPDIAMDADAVDLGRVRVGTTATVTITVRNEGDTTLHLDEPILEDDAGAFLIGDLAALHAEPGGSVSFDVTFSADDLGAASARLLLPSDDLDEPLTTLALVATVTSPTLTLTPPSLDFGTLEEACVGEGTVTLHNDGDEPLVVSAIEIGGGQDAFSVDLDPDTNGPLPWTIPAGSSTPLRVQFVPGRALTYAASVVVRSDDPANPTAAATLDGVATANAHVIDDFITLGRPLDFVFALGGTDADTLADGLVTALPYLTAPLSSINVDFQVAAIRADDGCLVNGLLPNGTMTEDEQLSAMTALLATTGTHHTLTLLERSLAESSSAGCNGDLLRERADLVLVGLTDTASVAPQASGVYSSAFEGVKSTAAATEAWVIGPDGGDCGARDDAWYDVTVATGGTYLSVCDDLATNLGALAAASIERQSAFPLSNAAWPDTLVVLVDGTATSEWTYDSIENEVVFATADAPAIGTPVRVFYDAVPACDTDEG